MVYEYLTEVYQPFWEKYSNLQVFNDEVIDKIDQFKLSNYIPFDSAWKKMIIMKLCKNSNYQKYIEWLESVWKKKSETEDLKQNNQYLMYLELKEILETEKINDYF